MTLPPILRTPLAMPVVAAPLFIASGPELVAAQCKAGVIGSFPALNARPSTELKRWLTQIDMDLAAFSDAHPELPVAPYAVNQIVHRSNTRLREDLEVCVEHRVPIVISSLGARQDVNDAIHSYGGIVLHDVINDKFAHKAIDKGADGLIAVATGAGGHAGAQSPFALVQEIRTWFDGPLLLSGAIAHGRSVLAAQAAGADFAYVGSAFLATHEARVDMAYKQMIADSAASDIVYSNSFTGVHGNYLRGSIVAAGMDPDNLPLSDPSAMDFGLIRPTSSPKPWKNIWGAGQGVGAVRDIGSVQDVVTRLSAEYEQARSALLRVLEGATS